MKFGHLELFVNDPLASLPFYRDVLGFEVVTVQAKSFVWLKLGEQEILLRPGRPFSTPPVNEIALTRLSATSFFPTSPPPCTIWNAPAGKPAACAASPQMSQP